MNYAANSTEHACHTIPYIPKEKGREEKRKKNKTRDQGKEKENNNGPGLNEPPVS